MSHRQSCSIKDLKCENVTVFADRAEIKRLAKFKLIQGENELVIDGVAFNSIDADSVRVEGHGDATVLDVVCQNKRVEAKQVVSSDQVNQLKKEISELEAKQETVQLKLERIVKQIAVLNEFANKMSTSTSKSEKSDSSKVDYEGFLNFLDMYSTKLETLDKEKYSIQMDLKEINEKLDVARSNLYEINAPQTDQSM